MRSRRYARWVWVLAGGSVLALFVLWKGHAAPGRTPVAAVTRERAPVSAPVVAGPHALPPAHAPLLSNRASLQAYAQEGDAAAASRLFNDMAWCVKRVRLQAWMVALQSDPLWNQSTDAYFHAQGLDDPAGQREALASIERNAQRVLDTRRMCEGTDAMLSDGSIYGAMLQAARLGDTAASACALVAPYRGPKLTPGEAGAYAEETRRYAEAALRKGSWASVFALGMVSSPTVSDGGDAGYAQYTYRPDRAMQLRYWALLRHGLADGTADARTFDGGIALMSAAVTPAQRNEALRWADETYAKYFMSSGPSTASMSVCEY